MVIQCGVHLSAKGSLMVQCARFSYVRNTDRWFQVPDSSGNKVTFPFDLPGLDPIQPVVLMFKVEMHGTADFRMYVNNHSFVIDFQTDPSKKTDSPRSWHEVIQYDQGLKASQNVLSILTEGSGAVIKLSDIVFLYHANAN